MISLVLFALLASWHHKNFCLLRYFVAISIKSIEIYFTSIRMSSSTPSQSSPFSFIDFENNVYRCLRFAFSTLPDATAQLRAFSEQLCGTASTTTDPTPNTEVPRSTDSPSYGSKAKEVTIFLIF